MSSLIRDGDEMHIVMSRHVLRKSALIELVVELTKGKWIVEKLYTGKINYTNKGIVGKLPSGKINETNNALNRKEKNLDQANKTKPSLPIIKKRDKILDSNILI